MYMYVFAFPLAAKETFIHVQAGLNACQSSFKVRFVEFF